MSTWQKFPTYAVNGNGDKKICNSPADYFAWTGVEVDERGEPIKKDPPPDPPIVATLPSGPKPIDPAQAAIDAAVAELETEGLHQKHKP